MGSAHWQIEPGQMVALAAMALAYGLRCRTLTRRGRPVSRARIAAFAAGVLLLFAALASPIDWYGENRLLWVHMVQHLLLGDLAPLCIVAGLSGALLRPLLAFTTRLRIPLRRLAHPAVALPLWWIDFVVWHIPAVYDAALADPLLHAAEHTCFFMAGVTMWAAVLEPIPGPAWFGNGAKAIYTLAVRAGGTAISMVFIWAGSALYPAYRGLDDLAGVSPLTDQQIAGLVMFTEGSIVTMLAFAWLFFRWYRELELRQRLVEHDRTLDPVSAARIARYGRSSRLRELTR